MQKKKRVLIIIGIILICIIGASIFQVSQLSLRKAISSQTKQTAQQIFPANSPEEITQAYYNLYSSCLKQHSQDLNSTNIEKDCPLNKYVGLSPNFDPKNELSTLSYADKVLCDEGIPVKMSIGKAYIGTDQTATVDVTTIFKDHHYTIPVLLHNEKGSWKIFRIECDLDGHID